MTANHPKQHLSWWPAAIPYFAAISFPLAFLQHTSLMFADSGREIHRVLLIGWFVLAVCSVASIVVCLQQGSKPQQLVALISIPAFAPLTALSFVWLYWIGCWK